MHTNFDSFFMGIRQSMLATMDAGTPGMRVGPGLIQLTDAQLEMALREAREEGAREALADRPALAVPQLSDQPGILASLFPTDRDERTGDSARH
ncbi:MAG: hypothetical protein ABIO70_28760 [Pseudomonadota bacterium]